MGEFLPNLLCILLHMIQSIVRPFYRLVYYKKPCGIPPIKNPLLKVSATTLARKIRNGELSSQTVVEAYIERIKEVNPFINAVIEDRFEAALNEAKTCDAQLKAGEVVALILEKEKPLYGVPITIKESCSLKGMSFTGGCLKMKDRKASTDGEAVELMKKAGAIPLLVSNTSELCTSLNSFNYLFGQTANPYDRRKTSGGSSGGEAALIASGASVLGLGSDLVGSIRIPAFYNGIFGHKPSPGMVPVEGHFPIMNDDTFKQFLVLGPLARYADDLHLAMRVLTSKSEIPLRLDEPLNLKNLRILYTDNFNSFCGIRSTTSDIRDTIHKAIRYFSKNGARVEPLSEDWLSSIYYFVLATFQELDIPEMLVDPKNPEKKRRPILEFLKATIGLSDYTSSLTLVRLIVAARGFISRSKAENYKNAREELRQKINNTLKDNTVFIYPTFPHPACFPELAFFEFDRTVYTAFANLMLLPSTHVPMGLDNSGMPIGFQITAATHQDHLCLAIAKELEKAFGGWIPPS